VQQLVVLLRPTPTVTATAATVDLTHALSMLAALVLAPHYRRAEVASATVAIGAAALDVAMLPRRRAVRIRG
jgi:hypothetical protein